MGGWMPTPNFLIVGAQKSGTTSMYHYLKSHPQIFLCQEKEPKYFSGQGLILPQNGPGDKRFNYVSDWNKYLDLFQNSDLKLARGEASIDTMYYHSMTIPLIKSRLGEPKILIFLRNPVDRAYSAYTHLLREGDEVLSFEEALASEESRIAQNWRIIWHLKRVGLYADQVIAFQKNFRHVGIWLFEDVVENTQQTIKEVYEFLGVDPEFKDPNHGKVYNQSGVPKSSLVNRIFAIRNPVQDFISRTGMRIMTEEGWIKFRDNLRNRNLDRSKMKPETRQSLINYFQEDINKLAKLINRDLSIWLNK
jgi:hypothetical protein